MDHRHCPGRGPADRRPPGAAAGSPSGLPGRSEVLSHLDRSHLDSDMEGPPLPSPALWFLGGTLRPPMRKQRHTGEVAAGDPAAAALKTAVRVRDLMGTAAPRVSGSWDFSFGFWMHVGCSSSSPVAAAMLRPPAVCKSVVVSSGSPTPCGTGPGSSPVCPTGHIPSLLVFSPVREDSARLPEVLEGTEDTVSAKALGGHLLVTCAGSLPEPGLLFPVRGSFGGTRVCASQAGAESRVCGTSGFRWEPGQVCAAG